MIICIELIAVILLYVCVVNKIYELNIISCHAPVLLFNDMNFLYTSAVRQVCGRVWIMSSENTKRDLLLCSSVQLSLDKNCLCSMLFNALLWILVALVCSLFC